MEDISAINPVFVDILGHNYINSILSMPGATYHSIDVRVVKLISYNVEQNGKGDKMVLLQKLANSECLGKLKALSKKGEISDTKSSLLQIPIEAINAYQLNSHKPSMSVIVMTSGCEWLIEGALTQIHDSLCWDLNMLIPHIKTIFSIFLHNESIADSLKIKVLLLYR